MERLAEGAGKTDGGDTGDHQYAIRAAAAAAGRRSTLTLPQRRRPGVGQVTADEGRSGLHALGTAARPNLERPWRNGADQPPIVSSGTIPSWQGRRRSVLDPSARD